jgi:hypothetical protein
LRNHPRNCNNQIYSADFTKLFALFDDKLYNGLQQQEEVICLDIASADIAKLSSATASQQAQQSVDIAVMKTAMDSQSEIAEILIDGFTGGGHVDISV